MTFIFFHHIGDPNAPYRYRQALHAWVSRFPPSPRVPAAERCLLITYLTCASPGPLGVGTPRTGLVFCSGVKRL